MTFAAVFCRREFQPGRRERARPPATRDRVVPVGLKVTQIVVPKQLHLKLLTVAREYPTSGHLGVKTTLDRLTRHFYWVGVGKAVRAFCRICDVCQRLGKGGTLNQSSSDWQYLLQDSG